MIAAGRDDILEPQTARRLESDPLQSPDQPQKTEKDLPEHQH